MNVRKFNEEVLFTRDVITKVNKSDIAALKQKASGNRRERIRLCAHRDIDDRLHEMLIFHTRGTYIRPHKHVNKSEAFHIIEGALDVIIFDERGGIVEVIHMGEYSSGKMFFYRLSESFFHTVVPLSDFVVFHETTNGPFDRRDLVFAPWSPEEDNDEAVRNYFDGLYSRLGR